MTNKASMYMSVGTGSVDTMENWIAESPYFYTEHKSAKAQLDSLVEVELDEDGHWVEV
ncbi:hypothetical protein N5E99_10260 [Pseudomonas chengduensis]|uniref:Uncharacterized protein n=1 Tax=Pseudomonas sihuiensis TaxID=1274359 RepID=A0A1H2LJY5_9PSED|nr:hypothetical protein [Pseudomonas chengduensis]EQM69675.1 hypothetical protein L682_01740 [Pseudomonas alcaligenes OT 69]MDH1536133.1 hypothetical protein [Pseudomonas chengduensis]SDU81162.1 hypothetical protein SAMN05216363_1715 [Pseudomonas sihuiensis]